MAGNEIAAAAIETAAAEIAAAAAGTAGKDGMMVALPQRESMPVEVLAEPVPGHPQRQSEQLMDGLVEGLSEGLSL